MNNAAATVRKAASAVEVARALREVRSQLVELIGPAVTPDSIAAAIADINDAAMTRLIGLFDPDGSVRTNEVCWIVLGSQGRREQTLATDQDNALIVPDDASPQSRAALMAFAHRLNDALADCGYPLCRGGVMARNAECCLSLSEWRERFARWIDGADPQSLLSAAIFFDFRPIHGVSALSEQLRNWLTLTASRHDRFLLQLAHGAMDNQPPLGLLRDFVVARGGEHAGTIDLKVNGAQIFVEAARLYTLASGVDATNTLDRLRAAGPLRRIPTMEIEAYIAAFRAIQRLRLCLNAAQHRAGTTLHNYLNPDSLDASDRGALKGALRQARHLQARLARDFGATPAGFGA